MSLEQALAANTAAIETQTAALQALADAWNALRAQANNLKLAGCSAADISSAGVPQTESPQVEAPKASGTNAAAHTPGTSDPAPAEVPPLKAVAAFVDIKVLSAAVTAAATRNRDGLVALLAKYEVKRASEVPEGKWAQLVSELEAL